MQTMTMTPARIGKYKGEILAHAQPEEVLAKHGRHKSMPKNNSDTYIARRFLPYGATSTSLNTQNRFLIDGTGDRAQAKVQDHQTSEGVTRSPETIQAVNVTVVIQEYSCLYGFTNRTFDLYEDDIPKEMITQIGERVALVNEWIIWGALRACTNQFYGGSGTSQGTVNGGISLPLLRRIARNLQANHGKPVTKMLGPSREIDTTPVAAGFLVFIHTDAEPDIRDLPNFVPAEKYASGKPMPNEIGKCERFRFITSPDLPSFQDAGATVANAPTFYSTSAVNVDVYPFVVIAQDAWSQIAVRGKSSLKPTYIAPGTIDKADPQGQRGYAGTIWYKAVMLENGGWMAVGNVCLKALTN